MRAVFVAVAIVATAGPSLAQPSRQPSMIEEIVITSSTVDPSKLSNKERLARVCKAARVLKTHLQFQHEKDIVVTSTNDWFLRLSCPPTKSN